MSLEQEVAAHYGRDDRARLILAALESQGMDPDRLSDDDLAPVSEFHVRGRQATVELGEKLGLRQGMHVLDVGSGIGGASRFFAATYDCRITCRWRCPRPRWRGCCPAISSRRRSRSPHAGSTR
jgi:hypothetical protein